MHLSHLRETYDVTGSDIDPGMLAVAKRRLGNDVPLVQADMRELEIGRRFDAVICLFSAIAYMPTAADLDCAIARMVAHLNPRGVIVVDGWVRPEKWRDGTSLSMDHAAEDGRVVARVGRTWRAGDRTVFEAHHLVGTAAGVDHIIDRHEMTLFTDAQYLAAFAVHGLATDVLPSPMADRDRYIGVLTG